MPRKNDPPAFTECEPVAYVALVRISNDFDRFAALLLAKPSNWFVEISPMEYVAGPTAGSPGSTRFRADHAAAASG